MFRRFSLFDAAPPSSTVSVSRPKPPPVPKSNGAVVVPEFRAPPRTDPINIAGSGVGDGGGVGGDGGDGGGSALASNGNRSPHLLRQGSSTSELLHLHQTPGHSPGSVGSASSATSAAAAVPPPPVGGGIRLLSSSPASYHRQSSISGSAPTNPSSALQQQLLYAAMHSRQPVNNVPVVQAAAAGAAATVTPGPVPNGGQPQTTAARERYSSGRSISSPVSPSQFADCPLSTSMPTSIKYYYTSPTWYSRFSHSLRKNVLRRSTSAHNSQNLPVADPFLEKVPLSDLEAAAAFPNLTDHAQPRR
uniref:Uncharacterized protein n=1 Tax=Anopheles epiroticus TaxID=199890 RepID=A0A182PH38_9DIPT